MSKDGFIESMDGNTAAAHVAHAMNEVIAIYPITPSSVMGELSDAYSAAGKKNVFGQVPEVIEMQSEGGAAGAVHGALAAGTLTTTFTASQGLLLMLPNMYKIAGELLPTTFHVSARSISTQALSIFGDHQDVMAARMTGYGLTASANPQEVMDIGCITTGASLKSEIPYVHFFDGFRTSHEIRKIHALGAETMLKMYDADALEKFRFKALNPDRPMLKGTAQNPDIYFQSVEARNPWWDRGADIFNDYCERFEKLTGRTYKPFVYVGAPDAELVMIIMGSGADTMEETIIHLAKSGVKIGAIKTHLYRPWSDKYFFAAMPKSARKVVVFDRTKEFGGPGEPLYLDVCTAFDRAVRMGTWTEEKPHIFGGRYGLSSKEFTPGMIKGVVDHYMNTDPAKAINGFTTGIIDDVTNLSIPYEEMDTQSPRCHQAKFYGLGSDGTVGANKNSIKVIGDNSDLHTQGFFVYDSKKAGAITISHLRFSPDPIRSTYLVKNPDFVAIHNSTFLGRYDVLEGIKEGGTVLLNTILPEAEIFASFPEKEQQIIIDKKLKVYYMDANAIVNEIGLPGRINTTMQAAFFKISGILEEDIFIRELEGAIEKSFASKGADVVEKNLNAFRRGLDGYRPLPIPAGTSPSTAIEKKVVIEETDKHIADMINNVILPVMKGKGDDIPVSALPPDGAFPTHTSKYDKPSIATVLPQFNPAHCVQCNRCVFGCPHAAIRANIHEAKDIQLTEEEYPTVAARGVKTMEDPRFRIQVYPDDCTGCGVCVDLCIGKDKESGIKALQLVPKEDILAPLRKSVREFTRLPEPTIDIANPKNLKNAMFLTPLFEFSGACAGCGETPYIKLVTQLCGNRMIQANATGCSSIYGGTAPVVPFATELDRCGHASGPAWASSLFEDNAEYGLGMRLAVDQLHEQVFALRDKMMKDGAPDKVKDLLGKIRSIEEQRDPDMLLESREAVIDLREMLGGAPEGDMRKLAQLVDYLIRKEVWIVGGDGWAYDIGFGGLDHVVASGRDVNVLVLDTEVYSNTGGQRSKATALGQVAKFAVGGKEVPKKDLGMIFMSYKTAYIAQVSYQGDPVQTYKAIKEALEFPGTSVIIAFSNCIEHGIRMGAGPTFAKLGIESGYWPIFRYDPRLLAEKKNPLQLDSKKLTAHYQDYAKGERRFRQLFDRFPDRAQSLMEQADRFIKNRFAFYQKLAEMDYSDFIVEAEKMGE